MRRLSCCLPTSSSPSPDHYTFGGRALRHYAALRVLVAPVAPLLDAAGDR
jgi:hypothetical protein